MTHLSETDLNLVFREARTLSRWQDRPVDEATLRAVFALAIQGPTAVNAQPARFVFVRTPEAKERLRPALAAGNLDKTMAAPVTAIIAYDLDFVETLPRVFPHLDARPWFQGNEPLIQETAFRNSSLQAAYLILAARSLGLDAGPMSGFDPAKVDAAFFPSGRVKSNMLVNLGYGDRSGLHHRHPRFDFDDVCTLA